MDDRSDPLNKNAPRARYDRDLYTWAVEQAALLRSGRVEEVDALNIAEEIDEVGNEQYDELESALRLIRLHLLNGITSRTVGHAAGQHSDPAQTRRKGPAQESRTEAAYRGSDW